MNFNDTVAYNERTMTPVYARQYAIGRYKRAAGANRLGMHYALNPKPIGTGDRDRYDYQFERQVKREWHANLAALRYGVSTYEQRRAIAMTPAIRRGYSSSSPVMLISANTVLRWLNKLAGGQVFCLNSPTSRNATSIFDHTLGLVEDMRMLYDGSFATESDTTESPHFPGFLYRKRDQSMTDVVVGVERGRYVLARAPVNLVKQEGGVPFFDVVKQEIGDGMAAQLMQRVRLSRTSGTEMAAVLVLPAVVAAHPRLFKSEFLRVNYGRGMTDYHSSARYLRGEADEGDVTLGLEWEVGVPSTRRTIIVNRVMNALSKAAGTMEYVHAERDGSLHNQGVEFVFAYRSLAKHTAAITEAFAADALLPQRNQTFARRLTPIERAGIHVHVGLRDRISDDHIGWDTLARMHNVINLSANRSFITALAGRRANHYTRYSDTVLAPSNANATQRLMLSSRYSAINVRTETVELRIFATGTTPQWLLMTLEFAEALRQYCADDHGLSTQEHAFAGNFVKWLSECEECYPNLLARIREFTVLAELELLTPPQPTVEYQYDEDGDVISSRTPLTSGGLDVMELVNVLRQSGLPVMTDDELLSALDDVNSLAA